VSRLRILPLSKSPNIQPLSKRQYVPTLQAPEYLVSC
jgi:hypothetical protein